MIPRCRQQPLVTAARDGDMYDEYSQSPSQLLIYPTFCGVPQMCIVLRIPSGQPAFCELPRLTGMLFYGTLIDINIVGVIPKLSYPALSSMLYWLHEVLITRQSRYSSMVASYAFGWLEPKQVATIG